VLQPGYTVAMSNLGVVVQGLGFWREAEVWFEQAAAADLKPYYAQLDQQQEPASGATSSNSNSIDENDARTLKSNKQARPTSSAVFNLANLFRDQVRWV